jgi:hypothetical protein
MSVMPEIWLEEWFSMEKILKNHPKKSYRKIVKEYAEMYEIDLKTARLFVRLILPEMVRLNIIEKNTKKIGINGSYKWVEEIESLDFDEIKTPDPQYQSTPKSSRNSLRWDINLAANNNNSVS